MISFGEANEETENHSLQFIKTMISPYTVKTFTLLTFLFSINMISQAQTDLDAIMMAKKRFCIGPAFMHSSWKNYWEGDLKRNNENLGTVSSTSYAVMGNYGISDKLNVIFSLPYVQTKATAGTLRGMQGFQDLSLFVKYMPIEKDWGKGTISFYGIAGMTTPVSNYVADFLPLSIGVRSTTFQARLLGDYQRGSFFITTSATMVMRGNITIDREAYYTDHLILSNRVSMPHASQVNVRTGYRSERLIAEAVLNQWNTWGGFDITRNNMPFPSNKMNATSVGVKAKYVILTEPEFSVEAGADQVIVGRNMGQSSTIHAGLLYVLDFNKKEKEATKATPVSNAQ